MNTNDVFALASRQASWLLARQAVLAQNVANSNTPGYKAADLAPFEATLQTSSLQLTATAPGHMSIDASQPELASSDYTANAVEASYSGNDVNQEQEMTKAGEVARAYSLNTAIVKAFNGMVLAASKG